MKYDLQVTPDKSGQMFKKEDTLSSSGQRARKPDSPDEIRTSGYHTCVGTKMLWPKVGSNKLFVFCFCSNDIAKYILRYLLFIFLATFTPYFFMQISVLPTPHLKKKKIKTGLLLYTYFKLSHHDTEDEEEEHKVSME